VTWWAHSMSPASLDRIDYVVEPEGQGVELVWVLSQRNLAPRGRRSRLMVQSPTRLAVPRNSDPDPTNPGLVSRNVNMLPSGATN